MTREDSNKQFAGFAIFVLACVFLAFLVGAGVAIFKVYPYQPLRAAYQAAYEVLYGRSGEASIDDEQHFLYPARYAEAGVTEFDQQRAQPGVTLVTGYWYTGGKWQPAIRLIDMQGDVLHEWIVRPEKIWPKSPFTDHVAGKMNTPMNYVHGSWLLPDGDVVFNVEYAGLVRMSACGDIVWTVPYRTHHSVFQDDDGNFWVSGLNWRYEKIDRYVHMQPEFVDETMLQISPDGEILREIFVLDALYQSGYGDLLATSKKTLDVTHMNDVEVLSASMAAGYPNFVAGDILVSLRDISSVLVFDGETEKVKWLFRHPLIHQHDPDFEPGGQVVIFDNNEDMTQQGMRFGPSRLIQVDTVSNEWSTVYPLTDQQAFYTQTGGKHQLLENGNRLITEVHGGRVFEVDSEGNTVWNWIVETRGDGLVPEVLEGTRYPARYADFSKSTCQ